MRLQHLLAQCKEQLLPICRHEVLAEQEAWWMLEQLTGKKQAELLMSDTIDLTNEQQEQLNSWLTQRVKERKPLQYILGSVPFCNLDILVQPPILIPRPETEEWVSWLITQLQPVASQPLSILDLCSGSGCIALALAKALPQATVVGIDKNPVAIALSEKNKEHNKITNVTFMAGDVFDLPARRSLGGGGSGPSTPFVRPLVPRSDAIASRGMEDRRYDLIVSNPPYLSEEEWYSLDESVRAWEDYDALVANQQGYAFYDALLSNACKYLKQNSIIRAHDIPQVVFEIGIAQQSIESWLTKFNFSKYTVYRDLEGVKRWVSVQV